MIRFFDAHCHLQDERIVACIHKVIEEALERGVERFSCNGTNEEDWERVKQLSEEYPSVTPNFGLHPWWVGGRSDGWLKKLKHALLGTPKAGLGECGLDHARRGVAEAPVQEQVFRQQLQLGRELQRPVSVHCVKAFGALLDILQQEGPFPAGLVLHSWAGSDQVTRQLARMEGVHFSLSGHTLGLSHKKLAPMLQQIPLDRLLLETDSPDGLQPLLKRSSPSLVSVEGCALVSGRQDDAGSSLNHPANIRAVLEHVADCLEAPQQKLAEAAFANGERLFP